MYSSAHLSPDDLTPAKYTVCQSQNTDTTIYFQVEKSINDAQVCFIPMHKEGNDSTYIGEPRCLHANDPSKIYQIYLYKTRVGFENVVLQYTVTVKFDVINKEWMVGCC